MADSDYVTQAFMEISATGAKGVNCAFDSVTEEFATRLKENWILLSVHGMKTDYDCYKALTFSPDIVITNKPIEIKSIIDKWRANAPVEYYGITTTQVDKNK
ncbi:hypothetical protein SDC9_200646 [bioreactor metagenome]|uniref:GP-PDE domain-containing protein n=1 Tax=bioreactor metagenome TaxID=1076179 RepID=A0A645J0L2_9ZZZZ